MRVPSPSGVFLGGGVEAQPIASRRDEVVDMYIVGTMRTQVTQGGGWVKRNEHMGRCCKFFYGMFGVMLISKKCLIL